VGAHEEIRDEPVSGRRVLPAVLAPKLTCQARRVVGNRVKTYAEQGKSFAERLLTPEVGSHLGPHHVVREQRAGVLRRPQRLARALAKDRVSAEDVQ